MKIKYVVAILIILGTASALAILKPVLLGGAPDCKKLEFALWKAINDKAENAEELRGQYKAACEKNDRNLNG